MIKNLLIKMLAAGASADDAVQAETLQHMCAQQGTCHGTGLLLVPAESVLVEVKNGKIIVMHHTMWDPVKIDFLAGMARWNRDVIVTDGREVKWPK